MYSGTWLPIITPLNNGKVDVDALQRLACHYLDRGISGFVALGTTGEAALLSQAERVTVLRALHDVIGSRLPMLVGVGGMDTCEVVADITQYERFECAGYLVSAPAYICPDQDGIQWHFEQAAMATERSIVLYNVPHRTGVNIAPDTVARLVEQQGNIVAIKECVADHFNRLRSLPIDVLCGSDEAFIDCLNAGGAGGILASAHVFSDSLVEIQRLISAGEQAQAREWFATILPVIRLLFAAPNPSAIKAALMLELGLSDETRMPIRPAPTQLVERLRLALDEYRLHRLEPVCLTN